MNKKELLEKLKKKIEEIAKKVDSFVEREEVEKIFFMVVRILIGIGIGCLCYLFPNTVLPVVAVPFTFLICFYILAIVSSKVGDWPFTRCKENRAKMLISLGGKVVDLIFNSGDYVISSEWRSVPVGDVGDDFIAYKRNFTARTADFLLSIVGLEDIKWVGIFRKVRKYRFRYYTIEKDDKEGKVILKPHVAGEETGETETPWIYLNLVRFGFEMKSVEALDAVLDGKAAVPLDLICGVVLRIENLRKAILGVDGWLPLTLDIIKSHLIMHLAENSFEDLAKNNISVGLLKKTGTSTEKTTHQAIEQYGIVSQELYIANIDFFDKADAARQKAKWAAEKQAQAVEAAAKGEARATDERRKADVQYLKEVCAIPGGGELAAVRISLEKAKINKEMEENYNSTIQGTVEKAKSGVILNISRQGNANNNDAVDMAALLELQKLNKKNKKEEE